MPKGDFLAPGGPWQVDIDYCKNILSVEVRSVRNATVVTLRVCSLLDAASSCEHRVWSICV